MSDVRQTEPRSSEKRAARRPVSVPARILLIVVAVALAPLLILLFMIGLGYAAAVFQAIAGLGIPGVWTQIGISGSGTLVPDDSYGVPYWVGTLNTVDDGSYHAQLVNLGFDHLVIIDGHLGEPILMTIFIGILSLALTLLIGLVLWPVMRGVRDPKLQSVLNAERLLHASEVIEATIPAATVEGGPHDSVMIVATNERYLVFPMTKRRQVPAAREFSRDVRLDPPPTGWLQTRAFGQPLYVREQHLDAARTADAVRSNHYSTLTDRY